MIETEWVTLPSDVLFVHWLMSRAYQSVIINYLCAIYTAIVFQL